MRYGHFKVILLLLLLGSFLWGSESVVGKQPGLYKLLDLSAQGRYSQLIQTYADLKSKDKGKAEALYLLGYAYMQVRKPDEAKPYLQAALKKGFNGYPNWSTAESLLQRIKTAESLRPPFISEISDAAGQLKMRVYGCHTEWINYVLSALPLYLKRAETVFGAKIPLVDFFLFAGRYEYDAFFRTVFDGHQPTAHQDGTGDKNMVLFCQIGDSGKIEIPAGSKRALGNVLHEYAHSICHTIYGDNYLEEAPQWLDEGMADYVAEPYFAEQYRSYDLRLEKFAKNHGPPSYRQMCRELRKEPQMRYAIGCFMVQELIADRGPGVIDELLEKARQSHDFGKAILEVAGYKPQTLLQRVVRKYWSSRN